MFHFDQLKQVHLEISSKCQASCPMCARNIHGGKSNPILPEVNWSIDEFINIFDKNTLSRLESIYFCGNYGDPGMNLDLPMMCSYAKNKNPDLNIRIHTNGGMQSKTWWKQLVNHLPIRHSVIFSIDGLEDTNEIYRIGVKYNRVIENALAFIGSGGNAEWSFLEFSHNQHQLEEARNISINMGFSKFHHKQSNRFVLNNSEFAVYDKNGNVSYNIKPPSNSKIQFVDKKHILNYKSIVNQSEILCKVSKTKEVYIDAFKNLAPCCFVGAIPYAYYDSNSEIYNIRQTISDQYKDYVSKMGGPDNINCMKHSIEDIINSDPYQAIWENYWNGNDKMIMCAKTCGKNLLSKPGDQFL